MSTEEETKAVEEPKTEETKAEVAGEDAAPEEHENTTYYEPVVHLEEQETKSGEEDETVIVNYRAKLFVFGETLLDKGTGKKTWRERGIGDVKILQHKENKKYRILMRQEKTMKPICNHVVDPRIEMQPQMSSDKAMMWSAFDFSEGELVETIFAMRFSNSDIATEFKKKFEDIQAEMKKLLEAEEEPPKDAEAEAAADETAEKLATLTTSE